MARQLIKNHHNKNAYELTLSVECACAGLSPILYQSIHSSSYWYSRKGIPLAHPTNCKLRTVHRIRHKQTRRINRWSNSWVEELMGRGLLDCMGRWIYRDGLDHFTQLFRHASLTFSSCPLKKSMCCRFLTPACMMDFPNHQHTVWSPTC